jgi:hypothetical protein
MEAIMDEVTLVAGEGDVRLLSGWTWGGCGHIELLWVRGDQRGNGLGTRLLVKRLR